MKVIIYGATGMIGRGVLLECLDAAAVEAILLIGRRSANVSHPKVTEVLLENLEDYSAQRAKLGGYDACFYCLGVSSAGMTEAAYTKVTYDFTLAAVRALKEQNPSMTFCFVSGEGTDSSEKGSTMWARVKGRAENAVLGAGFKAAYAFRPGFIRPLRGITSRTTAYRVMYVLMTPFFPLIEALFPRVSSTTVNIGRAMLQAASKGAHKPVLDSVDINSLAAAYQG